VTILASRMVNELLTATVVLGRAARLAVRGHTRAQALADVFCTGALRRVAELRRRWAESDEPDLAELSDAWLRSETADLSAAPGEARP
jgi:hypothetical protein